MDSVVSSSTCSLEHLGQIKSSWFIPDEVWSIPDEVAVTSSSHTQYFGIEAEGVRGVAYNLVRLHCSDVLLHVLRGTLDSM